METITKRLKSKTYIYSIILTALTVAQDNLPLLKEYLLDNYNMTMFVIIMTTVILRELTTKPISEK